MNTIYKYVLDQEITLQIPESYEILSIGEQSGDICMWVKVNPSAQLSEVKISIYGTGHAVPAIDMKFIGTVQMNSGLVFHAFRIND